MVKITQQNKGDFTIQIDPDTVVLINCIRPVGFVGTVPKFHSGDAYNDENYELQWFS